MADGNGVKRPEGVQTLKKMLTIFLFMGVILPLFLCILLFIKISKLQEEINHLKTSQSVSAESESSETALTQEVLANRPADGSYVVSDVNQMKKASADRTDKNASEDMTTVYLTFDDGPSSNTEAILDILEEYGVKATFFVIGKTQQQYVPLYQRIVEDGHTLGMHSFSHKYDEIYESEEAFWEDLGSLQEFLYDTTGVWSRFYRFPGGSSNLVSDLDMELLVQELSDQNIYYLDWNVSGGDATGESVSPQEIADNVVQNVTKFKTAVVLLHDANNKTATVEALPIMIQSMLDSGQVAFSAVNDEMHMVHHLY